MGTSALAIIPTGAEYQTLAQHAKNLVDSGFLPSSIRTPQQAIAIITLGAELKIGPWQAINGINVIQGKPTVSPQLMLALINASGELEDMKIEGDAKSCTVTMKRRNRTPHTETFTMQDAQAQQLVGKSNWQKMPSVMLKWRAVAAAARIVFPDIIIGMYTPEEIDPAITVNSEGELVGDIIITRDDKPAPKQTTVQHVVDGSTARVVEAETDEDEQPEPEPEHKPELSMQKSVTITTVNIRTDKNGRPYLSLTTSDGEVISEWSRRLFIEGHWIGEGDWTVTGETYGPYDIPAAIAKDDKGYWKLIHVTSAPTDPQPPKRAPKDVLGQGGNKGPVGRDAGEADDVPDDLPPTGMLPTAFRKSAEITIDNINDVPDLPPAGQGASVFSQKSQDAIEHRTAVSTGIRRYKNRGHQYIQLENEHNLSLDLTVNQFSKLIANLSHSDKYIKTVTDVSEPARNSFPTDIPALLVKFEMDGDSAKIISIAEFGDLPF